MEPACSTRFFASRPEIPRGRRCACRRLLAHPRGAGFIEVKCPRCRRVLTLEVEGQVGDVRCHCGRLLAQRMGPDGGPRLQMRCPRCKRHHDVDAQGRWRLVAFNDA